MDNELICYCFGYSAEDICRDVVDHGYSTIVEEIQNEKRLGRCQCAIKNPKGR